MNPYLDSLQGGLIVSCQARDDNPLRDTATIVRLCQAAVQGGAVGLRVEGRSDIAAVSSTLNVPVIGLWKAGVDGVFITPTADHALAVAEAGADIVALDGTRRPRPDGVDLATVVERVHRSTGTLVLADVASTADAEYAVASGADLVATTLAGYTGDRPPEGPDLDLVRELVRRLGVPVIAEGRYQDPEAVAAALSLGAHAVVVGTALTDLRWTTQRFAAVTEPGCPAAS